MKRYLLFAGDYHYPNGGWSDFVDSFDSVEEAQDHLNHSKDSYLVDWAHVVDTETMEFFNLR